MGSLLYGDVSVMNTMPSVNAVYEETGVTTMLQRCHRNISCCCTITEAFLTTESSNFVDFHIQNF